MRTLYKIIITLIYHFKCKGLQISKKKWIGVPDYTLTGNPDKILWDPTVELYSLASCLTPQVFIFSSFILAQSSFWPICTANFSLLWLQLISIILVGYLGFRMTNIYNDNDATAPEERSYRLLFWERHSSIGCLAPCRCVYSYKQNLRVISLQWLLLQISRTHTSYSQSHRLSLFREIGCEIWTNVIGLQRLYSSSSLRCPITFEHIIPIRCLTLSQNNWHHIASATARLIEN